METKERRSWTCGLPHPRHSLHPPRSFLPSSDLTHTQGNTHSGWMVVIRTSVRSLRASSGLSGRGHYHWLISGFWSTLAALRTSHFFFFSHAHIWTQLASAHTHNRLSFRYDCYSPFTIQSQGDGVKSLWRNWRRVELRLVCKSSPLVSGGDDVEVRRSEHKNHQSCYDQTPTTEKTDVQTSGFESDVGACCRRPLNGCVCVLFYLMDEKAWKSLARLISE